MAPPEQRQGQQCRGVQGQVMRGKGEEKAASLSVESTGRLGRELQSGRCHYHCRY